MKQRYNVYRQVDKLPAKAILVREYANSKNVTINAIYNMWGRHAAGKKDDIEFEIVLFKGMNFVIPGKKKYL